MAQKKKGFTKNEIAYIYAVLIYIKDFPFAQMNNYIIRFWSRSALIEIKKKAWDIAERLSEWEIVCRDFSTPKKS